MRSRLFSKTIVPAGQLDYTICIATWSRRDLLYWNCCSLSIPIIDLLGTGTGTRLNLNLWLDLLAWPTGTDPLTWALTSQLDHPSDRNPSNKCLTHKRLAHGQLRVSYCRLSFANPYSTSPATDTSNPSIRQLTSFSTKTNNCFLWNYWKTPLKTRRHFRSFCDYALVLLQLLFSEILQKQQKVKSLHLRANRH